VDIGKRQNPHVNYEPSVLGGLQEAPKTGNDHEPHYDAKLVRHKLERANDFKQAGETYRSFDEREREELIANLAQNLSICHPQIQAKMLEYFTNADSDYGRRVKERLTRVQETVKEHTSTAAADRTAREAVSMGQRTDGY
jgi:catalase